MADAIYSLGRERRGEDPFVVVTKPKGEIVNAAMMYITIMDDYPFDIWKNLIPEETPNFDDATDKLVVIDSREFCVEGDHS